MSDLNELLKAREKRYGDFLTHASITQQLKETMGFYGTGLDPDMCEALDMIANKIGRILNGDPHYADSWTDIAGYAQLVANRLIKEQKDAQPESTSTAPQSISEYVGTPRPAWTYTMPCCDGFGVCDDVTKR